MMSRAGFKDSAGRIVMALFVLAHPASLFGAAVEPSLAPQIASVFPRGGRQGAAFDIKISGNNLDRVARIEFTSPTIHAEIASSSARQILAHIAIGTRAEPGSIEFRLFTPSGTATGVFVVGTLPEQLESEPNDQIGSAQTIHYPILINGTAAAEDADLFRFEVQAGQTLAFDIAAARNGSPLDPVLAILDEGGREIGYCDDYYIEKDARLEYTFPRAGAYLVRVTPSYSRSITGADYRLSITDQAYPMYSIPAGAQRGANVRLMVRGSNLQHLDRVWLDTTELRVSVLDRSSSKFMLSVNLPADVKPGRHRLHFFAGSKEAANPINFEISESNEVTVTDEAASDAASPVQVAAPVIVNSEIGEHGSDYLRRAHVYEFDAPENGRYEFQVKAWDLGLRMDPIVTLFDPEGKKVAVEDDPAPNSFIHYAATHDPNMVYKFPKAGRYRVVVRDAMYRGGSGFIYRLTIRPTLPDFYVDVIRPQITAYVGRKAALLANVHRTGGVHTIEMFKRPDNEIENFRIREIDGWQSKILLHVEGIPSNVTVEPVLVEPRNTTFKGNDGEDLFVDGTVAEVPLQIGTNAPPGTYKIHIRAESTFDGRTITREARAFRKNRTLKTEPGDENAIYLTIVKPPPVLLLPPDRLEVEEGEVSKLKLNLYYFDQGQGPIRVEARAKTKGLNIDSVTVPATREGIEIPVSATKDAKDPIELVIVARDAVSGQILSESPPVNVRISSRPAPGTSLRGVN